LENLTKPISLREIVYPVFKLGAEKPHFAEGVVVFIRHYLDEDRNLVEKYKIVDDTNLPGDTLALRRIILLKNKVPLKPLGNAVFFLGDLIKIAHRKIWFIDSSGNIFQYKKSRRAKLEFKKIKLIHQITSGGAIIEVEGIASRFKCLHTPRNGEQYAGLLVDGRSYILYGLYQEKPDDTWRMI
jgi:hypothetical protein